MCNVPNCKKTPSKANRCKFLRDKCLVCFQQFIVFLTELLIGQTVLCYGMYYMFNADRSQDEPLNTYKQNDQTDQVLVGQWVPITFLAFNKITKSCFASILHSSHYNKLLIYCTVALVSAHLVASFNKTPVHQIITIGIAGGVISAFVSINLQVKLNRKIDRITLLAESCGLVIFPQVIDRLNVALGSSLSSQEVIGGVLLTLIPLGLLIRRRKKKKIVVVSYRRESASNSSGDVSIQTVSSENEEAEDDDEEESEETSSDSSSDQEEEYVVTQEQDQMTEASYLVYNLSHHRLSKIVEEAEEEEESSFPKYKKLNRVSAIIRAEATKKNESEVVEQTETEPSTLEKKWPTIEIEKKPAKKSLAHKLRKRMVRALKIVYLYPNWFSSLVLTVCPYIYLLLVPFLSDDNVAPQNILLEFGVAMSLCRVLGMLVEWKLPTVAVKIIFLFTNLLLVISYCEFGKNRINFGIQYAICSSLEKSVYENFVGLDKWKRIRKPVEFFSGISLILFYSIFYSMLKVDTFLRIALVLQILNTLLWLTLFVLKWILTQCKRQRTYVVDNNSLYSI